MEYNYIDCDLDHLQLTWVSVASLMVIALQYTLDSFSHSMPPRSSGDNGNFKSSTYHSAAQHITQHLTSGPMKTAAMVRNKWLSHIQKIYQDLEGFHTKSGHHWDNTCGAGVQGKFDKEVFEDYVKNHPLISPFKNSGWEFYDLMLNIMPNGAAHGTNAFTPGTFHASTMDYDTEHPLATSDGGERGAGPLTSKAVAPDRSNHPAGIIEWHQIIHSTPPSTTYDMPSSNMPPPPSSSLGKCSHSEMAADDDIGSVLPFADVSDLTPSISASNKQLELSAALTSTRGSRSCHSRQTSQAVLEPIAAVGLQGSINFLMSKITTHMSSAIEQALITRSQAIQQLDGEDHDLPRHLRAHIQSSIAQNVGFADMYLKMASKEDRIVYVELEYGRAGGSHTR
ncbi:hypothetical protein BKA83DRAFT_4486639 [Pisolithus microcarpus]|nr:hypothetical protein BKA83DRAFT_4486639 [Pisolithus microcarpus]